MTHQNHQTNGASLEDCHTNFFALTDLCGIKWRKFLSGERPNATGEPLDDPVLRSYSRCLECEILCVWRRVAAPKPEQDPNNTIPFDVVTSQHTHPPLSLTAAKELWIFWYGEEPDLSGLVDSELLKNSPGSDSGAWENGLSYECRSLLFKALHNLIERCLLSKDIVRLGKWFVQPCSTNDRIFGKSSQHLSFSFAFFVHGDTVCASIDLREHPAVRPLTPEYLAEAAKIALATTQSQNSDNINSASDNNSTTDSNGNKISKNKPVILAPFGMAATLTGNSYKAIDPSAEKIIQDWCSFYPLGNKDNFDLPPIVEVVSGGVKMRYPSNYVLVTDLDENEINCNIPNTNNSNSKLDTSTLENNTKSLQQLSDENQKIINNKFESKTLTVYEARLNNNNLGNIQNTHTIPTSAIEIPERVWQSTITKTTVTIETTLSNLNLNNISNNNIIPASSSSATINNVDSSSGTNSIDNNNINTQDSGIGVTIKTEPNSNNINNNNSNNNNTNPDIKNIWDFTDPTKKTTCICIRCKRLHGGNRAPSSSSSFNFGKSLFSHNINRSDKSLRFNRIPFHKRSNNLYCIDGGLIMSNYKSNQKHQKQNDISINNNIQSENATAGITSTALETANTTLTATTTSSIMSYSFSSFNDPAMIDTSLTNQRSSTTPGTPHGGASSYSRNSIGDSMPVPSVGSPGSAIMSPHPNSHISQPTSVPPSELLPTLSPRASASVPPPTSIQPITPMEHQQNTPAPTPTDQHDNKSITASPYIQPSPIVEPPLSVDTSSVNDNNNTMQLSVKKFESPSGLANPSIESKPLLSEEQTDQPQRYTRSALGFGINDVPKIEQSYRDSVLALLKRPQLITKDFDSNIDDEFYPQLLYDYTSLNAWMDHPVKRFRPDEDNKQQKKLRSSKNLYDSHQHSQPPMLSPNSFHQISMSNILIKKEIDSDYESGNTTETSLITGSGVLNSISSSIDSKKMKATDSGGKKGNISGNLYTEQGLQVSARDLDDLFDNSDDMLVENSISDNGDNSNDEEISGVQVHTPPDSNKSSNGYLGGMDDIKRSINPNTSILRPEELSKMFPTPPSLEQNHPNSSPMSGGNDMQMTDIGLSNENNSLGLNICNNNGYIAVTKIKQEMYNTDLGSPVEEPIEDWSYVYVPPKLSKYLGSTKYAPLTNLPSQTLPPIAIPQNAAYSPSWLQPQRQQQQATQPQQKHQQQKQQDQLQQQLQQQQPKTPVNNIMSCPPRQAINTSIIQNCTDSSSSNTKVQAQANPMLVNQLNNNNYRPSTPMMRIGMSPISPASGNFMATNSPMRRTPIHPPPPYELAVSSPATSTSSYLNKQFNSQEPADTPCSQQMGSSQHSQIPNFSSEANSLLVNVLLYDTALNIFRDHNFDSCTLCVCNQTQKCVGNIRGSDSGLYVALPGTSFNPSLVNQSSSPASSHRILSSFLGGGGNSNCVRSAFGMDSPSCGPNSIGGNSTNGTSSGGGSSQQHLSGYIDEDQIQCLCGFSAVVNRRLAHRSGLFYEDEMEITGMAEDPAKYKQKTITQFLLNGLPAESNKLDTSNLQQVIMDLLRNQCCSIIQTSVSSIQRTLTQSARKRQENKNSKNLCTTTLNILEFSDANDVVSLAIEQGRIFFENQRLDLETYRPLKSNQSMVHKWPYIMSGGTRNNQDIVRIMKSMQPLLQNAFHCKSTLRAVMRDTATYQVKGPLTWRQFHRLAGRGTGQCEPQPIPSVIVGHEKDWLSVAPYAIHYWDKLLLEPYSYARDVCYLVIAPENEYIVSKTKTYFKELSTTYEMCKLGRHTPIKGWDGILQVGKMNPSESSFSSEWFQSLSDKNLSEQLQMYAEVFQNYLAPYLQRIPNDKSLLDPPECEKQHSKDRAVPSPMPPPDPSQTISSNMSMNSNDIPKAPNTPKSENDSDNRSAESSATLNCTVSPISIRNNNEDDDINPPVLVLYIVEPFTCGNDSIETQRLACLSLLRIYSELLNSIPESVRCYLNIQIVSLESILEMGKNRNRLRLSDEIKCFALNVFSQCRRYLTHTNQAKSLTGFGTAANMDIFLKSKDDKNRTAYRLYTPPYILAPGHEKSDKSDSFRTKSAEQQYSVMYCNYCISEDQSYLLATATDDRGELLETKAINIDVPNRSRRRRSGVARRYGLKKLMDFILGIISTTVIPWRLVIGRIGRIGHGELKSWSYLLSKQNLQKASKQLKDLCKQCSIMQPQYGAAVPSILSACLVTLEPDSKLRVMPDQFTPDERFSQVSMQNPLSTPQDVTCTHILVFPTSAVCQSFQKAFNELNETGTLEEDPFFLDFEDDPQAELGESLQDFMDWDQIPMQQNSPERISNHGSPGRIEDNSGRIEDNSIYPNRNIHDTQDMEEVGSVLQQPLAVGYFVSTAPTGRMPSWFWASCPHLEDVCPVFLKTALHIHVSSIQRNTEDELTTATQSHSTATDHPLDSQLTADVLRYVLEGYNVLSWLALDSNTRDRLSCLPIHVQVLMQLYHMTAAMT